MDINNPEDRETLVDETFKYVAHIAEGWKDDTPTDEAARALIASVMPVLSILEKVALEEDFTPNETILMLMIRMSENQIGVLGALKKLGDLKNG